MDEQAVRSLRQQLREDLLPLILIPLTLSGMALVVTDPELTPPPSSSFLGLLLLGLVLLVGAMQRQHHIGATWLLLLGLFAAITLAWLWFPSSQPCSAFVFATVVAAISLGLLQCIGLTLLATAILVAGSLAMGLDGPGLQPVLTSGALLWATATVLGIAQIPERTLLRWVWQSYEQARTNLESARDRQLELKQALQDLSSAHRQVTRLNDMLVAARRAVDEARAAKEAFVAAVSHELRTPLNMIIGFCDIILETPEAYSRSLPPKLLADIDAIMRNGEHLAGLVDDVLDLSEAETGRLRLSKQNNSIREIAQEAAEAVAALFEAKHLYLAIEVPETLPLVPCDRIRIRQVLLNLLANAGRFTEQGGVLVRAGMDHQVVTVSVSDTGPGISADRIDKLFEPFQQGDPSIRRRYGGSGLGLAISKQLVELHGGRIWLESQIGIGTTVHFTLPLEEPAVHGVFTRWFNPYQEYTPRNRPSRAPDTTVRPQVVIVERGQVLNSLVTRALGGFDTVPATELEEAFQKARDSVATCILVNGPPGELTALCSGLPALPFDIPIVACQIPEPKLELARLGVQEYLIKPISRADLAGAIGRIAPDARTILIVDDDSDARQLFTRLLATIRSDYVVLQATNGEEALLLLRQRLPDLVLLDLVMPVMDGFAVLEHKFVDSRISGIPVVVTSAKDPEQAPINSSLFAVTRQNGLSADDLMRLIRAAIQSVQPRLGDAGSMESADLST